MNETPEENPPRDRNAFHRAVGAKMDRKLKARRNVTRDVWFGLGMMGLIGWSVVVPMLLGAALGLWLDKHHAATYSWTLALMLAGLALGCLNAWHWMTKEESSMQDEQGDNNE
jgi:ATP synthase protein I